MFITTANSIDTIPAPLLDRMEIIHLTGYTEEEKLKIAEKYLIPKQIKEHSLTAEQVKIPETVIREVINSYTRESGVRSLRESLLH